MGDDQMGASELRKRYHAGGSLPDDNLSASQLRARKGIKPNSKDWSTADNGGSGMILVAAFVLAAVGAAIYYMKFYEG